MKLLKVVVKTPSLSTTTRSQRLLWQMPKGHSCSHHRVKASPSVERGVLHMVLPWLGLAASSSRFKFSSSLWTVPFLPPNCPYTGLVLTWPNLRSPRSFESRCHWDTQGIKGDCHCPLKHLPGEVWAASLCPECTVTWLCFQPSGTWHSWNIQNKAALLIQSGSREKPNGSSRVPHAWAQQFHPGLTCSVVPGPTLTCLAKNL